MTDTISSDDGGSGPIPEGPSYGMLRRLGGASRTTAMTAAVSLVLLGGVATVTARNLASSADPADVVPASAFAIAQVDLSLPDGQDGALSQLVGRFPGAPKGSGSIRDRLLGALFKSSQDPHVDYAKSIRPWLGDHAAVAGWTDDSGTPQAEFVLESTDDGAARKALHNASPSIGLAFSHGFAVLATSQDAADAAVRASGKSSLAHNAAYSADLAALQGSPVLTGWVDGPGAVKAITRAAGGSPGALDFLTNSGLPESLTGRVAAGVRVSDDGDNSVVQLEVLNRGAKPSARSTSTDRLRHLPATTFAAAAIADPAGIVRNTAVALSAFTPFVAGTGTSCSGFVSPGQPEVTQCQDTSPSPADTDPLSALSAATGLSIPNDLVSLLGSDAVVAYGGLTGDGMPKIGVRSKPADTNAAADVVTKLRNTLSNSDVELAERTAGGDFVVATTDDYAAALAGAGTLGTVGRFADAMRGMPSSVSFATYVDLDALLPLLTQGRAPQLDHLQAVGLWTATVNGTSTMRVRLVVH